MSTKHPADIFTDIRRHMFALYEKQSEPGNIIEYLQKTYGFHSGIKTGLEAELSFYHQYYDEFQLEPLLDAGVKADFGGMKDGKLTNFDVTSNLDSKTIEEYSEVRERKSREYEIVLWKDNEISLYPLKFPKCQICDGVAHDILYLGDSNSSIYWNCSTGQVVLRYCESCGDYTQMQTHYEIVHSIKNMRLYMEDNLEGRFTNSDIEKSIQDRSIELINYFEHISNNLFSSICEIESIKYNPVIDEEFIAGRVYWKHPLAEKVIEDIIEENYSFANAKDWTDR